MIDFRPVPVDSPDAAMLMDELNETLTAIVGNNGTMFLHLADFSGERAVFIVGYAEDMPICCAGIREMDNDRCEIKRVFARPNRIGAGTQLLAALEAWASAHRYKTALLECRTMNRHAISFYLKNGYAVCENYEPYIGVEDAVCMKKELSPAHETGV